jgi:3-oxo-5alpha-steroid 4-dehydrogenase
VQQEATSRATWGNVYWMHAPKLDSLNCQEGWRMADELLNQISGEGSVVESPMRVADAASVKWAEEADVVVVGFGGAGAAAALEACEQGAEVLVIERFEGGGSTANSGGVYYAGGGTRFQRDARSEDTPQYMFDYLSIERRDAVSEETLRRFCDDSVANTEWIVKHGVRFEGSLYSGKTNYPPEDKYLYYSGNEKIPSFAAKAKPAARGHRTKGKGWTGYAFFAALKDSVHAHGIKVNTHCRAMRLVIDSTGAVIGIEVLVIESVTNRMKHQKLYAVVNPMRPFNTARSEKAITEALAFEAAVGIRMLIRARKGLILTTGGFTYNVRMVGKHMPFLAERNNALVRLGSMGCSGAGIQLGASAGGSTAKLDRSFLGRMIAPPTALVQGLIVNREGKRFVNEDAYNALLGDAIMQQSGGDAWIILDRGLYRALLRQCLPTGDGTFRPYLAPTLLNLLFGGTKKAASLAELAVKIGIDPVALQATVAETNATIERGHPDVTGKGKEYIRPLGNGPYRALNTSIGSKFSFCIFFTLGGLRVDELSGLVLTEYGTEIRGLYAAGRSTMGIPSDGYISGLSLADCIFSGRRAGRNAAHALEGRPVPDKQHSVAPEPKVFTLARSGQMS